MRTDIYGFQNGRRQIPKDLAFYIPGTFLDGLPWYQNMVDNWRGSNASTRTRLEDGNLSRTRSINNAEDADHARIRRLVAPTFTNSALHKQEGMLRSHIDLLVNRLRRHASSIDSTESVDLAALFTYLTWDVISDLSLGSSFGILATSPHASPAPPLFTTRGHVLASSLVILGLWAGLKLPVGLWLLAPGGVGASIRSLSDLAERHLQARLSSAAEQNGKDGRPGLSRADFIGYILQHNDEGGGMTNEEITTTLKTFLNAGSETTATTLSWCVWEVLRAPAVHARLRTNVRGRFRSAGEITLSSTGREGLPYLHAVVEETLRRDPVAIPIFPRVTAEHTVVDGTPVPPGTSVGVHQYSAYRSETNFFAPDEFVPERWLSPCPAEHRSDRRDALQPFSLGPRGCLGKRFVHHVSKNHSHLRQMRLTFG